MNLRSVSLTLGPVPEPYAAVYRRRGMELPEAVSGHEPAALWPYQPRSAHRNYALANGLFWLPCPLCQEPFGGHEIGDVIPDPVKGSPYFLCICPACTAERNGGQP